MPTPSVRTVLAFLLGFGLVISAAAEPLERLNGIEASLLARVNRVRTERHLPELRGSAPLASVALAHARDMAERGYVDHINPEGLNPLQRVQSAGVDGLRLLAENIGASSEGGDRIEAVVREWLRSESHRENLLNPAFNATGIAVVESPDGTTLVVQLYATF
jgi:uncharacterized protein YkwD